MLASILGNESVINFGDVLRQEGIKLWSDIGFFEDAHSDSPRLFIYLTLRNNTPVFRNRSYLVFRRVYEQHDVSGLFGERDWFFAMLFYEDQIVDTINFDETVEDVWWGEGNRLPYSLQRRIQNLCSAKFGETLLCMNVEPLDQKTIILEVDLKTYDNKLEQSVETFGKELTAICSAGYCTESLTTTGDPLTPSLGEFDWIMEVRVRGVEYSTTSNLD